MAFWLLTCVGALAVIVASLGGAMPFVLDDFWIIDGVRQHLAGHYDWQSFRDYFLHGINGQFVPFHSFVYLCIYLLFGVNSSVPYHVWLVICHVLVTICVWWCARHLGTSRLTAFMAAFFFAIFPYHYWAVWWVSNTGDLMTFALFVLAFIAFIKWVEGGKGQLICWSFLLVNLSFLSSCQGAMYPLGFLVYALCFRQRLAKSSRAIAAFLGASFLADCLWFSFRAHYVTGGNGITVNLLWHGQRVWARLLMFDIFSNPQTPLRGPLTIGALCGVLGIVALDILRSRSAGRLVAGSSGLLVGILLWRLNGAEPALNYFAAVFFLYYLAFGQKVERFLVLMLLSFSTIFLTVAIWLFSDRYLYAPSFALSILLAQVLTNCQQQLKLPQGARRLVTVLFLTGFLVLSAVFHYDKFWDWYSVTNLQERVIREIAAAAPQGATVVQVNSSMLHCLDIPVRDWRGRLDLTMSAKYGLSHDGFLLGDAYFINYNHMRRALADPRFVYEAAVSRAITTPRANAFIYDRIQQVEFRHQGQEGMSLAPEESVGGIVFNKNQTAWLCVVYAASQPGLRIELDGKQLAASGRPLKQGTRISVWCQLPVTKEPARVVIRNISSRPVTLFLARYGEKR